MKTYQNELGQQIGAPVNDWQSVERPPLTIMDGRFCHLEPIDIEAHATQLFQAYQHDKENRNWTYLPYGPFVYEAGFRQWISDACLGNDPMYFTVIDKTTSKAVGVATFMRIEPAQGVIEVGHINFSPLMQRTAMATEAMYLMMRRVFEELGYRRYEWKCDSLNAPSRKAAERLGMQFEGIFRQATMYKGRNRDTAWYSITDQEWPALNQAFKKWLALDNFYNDGQQKVKLSDLFLTSN